MNHNELIKTVVMVPPQVANDGGFAGNAAVDTRGFTRLRAEFIIGDTDVAVGSGDDSTPPFLEECDTEEGDYTPIEDAELSDVIGAADDGKVFAIDVNLLKAHKRFVRVSEPTAGDSTGAYMCVLGRLFYPATGWGDAAGQGLEELIRV